MTLQPRYHVWDVSENRAIEEVVRIKRWLTTRQSDVVDSWVFVIPANEYISDAVQDASSDASAYFDIERTIEDLKEGFGNDCNSGPMWVIVIVVYDHINLDDILCDLNHQS